VVGKVWVLYRVLSFATGESKVLSVGTYENARDAQSACDARNVAISVLLAHGQLSINRGQKLESAETVPFTEALHDLGITAVGFAVKEERVLGPEITRIDPSILLPGSRH
jgi:hypothetical protein